MGLIFLGWLRPLRYSGGQRMNDLDSFLIERAGSDGRFAKVEMMHLEDQNRFRKERHLEWTDRDVHPGETYLYRITAVTLDGYRSPPTPPVSATVPPAAAPR